MTAQYIEPASMTDRQLWAAGALSERFFTAGTLDTVSADRDRDAAAFLADAGYQSSEIAPIVSHMNACADLVKGMALDQREALTSSLEASIAEGRHKLPAPN